MTHVTKDGCWVTEHGILVGWVLASNPSRFWPLPRWHKPREQVGPEWDPVYRKVSAFDIPAD